MSLRCARNWSDARDVVMHRAAFDYCVWAGRKLAILGLLPLCPHVSNTFMFSVLQLAFPQSTGIIIQSVTFRFSTPASDLYLQSSIVPVGHIHQQHQFESVVPLLPLIAVGSDSFFPTGEEDIC